LSGQAESAGLSAVIWNWLNTNSLAIQAIALVVSVGVTVFLVYYTRKYVGLTQSLAKTGNAELLNREKARKARRIELESLVRAPLNTLQPLEVYGSIGLEALEKTMRESKSLDWADFERFTTLAAEVDSETARQVQVLKRDLSWLNERIKEVKLHRSGFSDDPWTRKPSVAAPEWNSALLSSREALDAMLKKLA
jgi:hypothetical protein